MIYQAFEGVKFEDGIGLWEGQGHDDRLTSEECSKYLVNHNGQGHEYCADKKHN